MVYSSSHWRMRLSVVFLVSWSILVVTSAFSCHPKCNCIWRNGKQTAECSGVGFSAVPSELDSGVQVLSISRNKLHILHRDAFLQVGLVNLQKVFLVHCDIDQVNEYAFNRLTNLVELDLSFNKLTIVPSASFIHVPRLRELKLNGNPLSTLPNHAFSSAKSLTVLEVSKCHIHTIAPKAFDGLENLQVLRIDFNSLETVSGKTMIPLKSLNDISLYDNPWRCDCELRTFRQWLDENNIPYTPPICHQPLHIKDKMWNFVEIDDFSCPPQFLNTSSVFNVYENVNVTLDCRVKGDPSPTVKWVWRQRTIANISEGISSQQTFVVSETGHREKLSRLKITFVQDPNAGTYTCIAENLAGVRTKNFTLVISRHPVTEQKITDREKPQEVREKDSTVKDHEEDDDRGSATGMIIGIVIGALLVFLICALLLWILRRRQLKPGSHKRQDISHKVGNLVGNLDAKESQEDVDLKLLAVTTVKIPPRLGAYEELPTSETDTYDSRGGDTGLPPRVWEMNDHILPNPTWESPLSPESNFCLPPPPSQMEKQLSTRSPIIVPMPVPQGDLHSRLQNELADTLRRKGEKKSFERERGDGSSELEATGFENNPKTSEPGIKEPQKQNSVNDNKSGAQTPLNSGGNTPDLLFHPHQVDNPSAYFRPISDTTSEDRGDKTSEDLDGGADGTEV
ncbi:uncharacterized protein LOC143249378 [Tachypleus tridentatus]|uniref:uncharacterized protein LOC143249378 n=1 Tax=Tachypleus tridentatus TaxID=6853 RepID=UPI003FCFEFBF